MKLKVKLKFKCMYKDLSSLSPLLLTVTSISTVIIEPNYECSYFIFIPCTSDLFTAFMLFFSCMSEWIIMKDMFFMNTVKNPDYNINKHKIHVVLLSCHEQMIENIF